MTPLSFLAVHSRLLLRIAEVIAVVFNLLFTFLYLHSNPWCYFFGIAGPLLFLWLCYSKKLYAEMVLQIVYTLLAVYGLLSLSANWQREEWTPTTHLLLIGSGVAAIILGGRGLKRYTDAKLPFLDSTTTVFGIIGTWVMMNYVHANWLYFIGVNALSIVLYARRGMWVGAGMFVIYLLMAIDGYFRLSWF